MIEMCEGKINKFYGKEGRREGGIRHESSTLRDDGSGATDGRADLTG